jgi:hypothetical protein
MSTVTESVTRTTTNVLHTAENALTKTLTVFDNKYLHNVALVILLAYLPFAAPKLPPSIVKIMGNYAVKFVYLFMITYLLTGSVKLAAAVGLVITVTAILLKKLQLENFVDTSKNQILSKAEVYLTNDSNNPMTKVRRMGETVLEKAVEHERPSGVEEPHAAAPADHSETLHPTNVKLVKVETEHKKPHPEHKDDDYTGFDEYAAEYDEWIVS